MDLLSGIVAISLSLMMMGIVVAILAGWYLFTCIGRMRMFQKAGVEGWKAWIPLYRDYVLCQITMGAGWYFIFGLIPGVSVLMQAVYAYEVMLSYGQSVLFGVLYFFLPVIAELICGFGGSVYCGSQDLDRQIRDMFSGPSGGAGNDGPHEV